MSADLNDADLSEFIATLRGATPGPSELAAMRRGVVAPRPHWTPWWAPALALALAFAPWSQGAPAPAMLPAVAADAPADLGTNGNESAGSERDAELAQSAALASEETQTAEQRAGGSSAPSVARTSPRTAPAALTRASLVRPETSAPRPSLATPGTSALHPRAATPSSDRDLPHPDWETRNALPLALIAQVALAAAPQAAEPAEPSAQLARALSAYARGRCADALPELAAVVEGSTGDATHHAQRAELLLGECLIREGWLYSGTAVLEGIARSGESHRFFDDALLWLARAAPRLADPAAVAGATAAYGEAHLARIEGEERGSAAYLVGRAHWDAGELERAARILESVPAGHRFFVPARFLSGVAHVRLRHARPAQLAFRALVDAVSAGRTGGYEGADRARDLAQLSLARIAYTAASSARAVHDEEREGRLLAQAIRAWAEVPLGSEVFLDAFSEETWAFFLAGDDPRALGHVHALLSPFFRDHAFPEALVIRATIQFSHCLWDETERTIADYHARYDEALTELEGLEARSEDEGVAIGLLSAQRERVGARTSALLDNALGDRELQRLSASIQSIAYEESRLGRGAGTLAPGTPLALRMQTDLSLAHTFARARLADAVRGRITRMASELRERTNDADAILLEVHTARRTALDHVRGDGRTAGVVRERIEARDTEVVWPFDGEYWEDELPHYRVMLPDRCGR